MNPETLSLPVPYTLEMTGTGSFIATWKPVVPSNDLPNEVQARSSTSGVKAIERLYGKLLASGVTSIYPTEDELEGINRRVDEDEAKGKFASRSKYIRERIAELKAQQEEV